LHQKHLRYTINNCLSETLLNELARATKFTKRSGKIPAHGFLNALLASENDQAHTSLPDLATGLRQAHNIEVSKEAMHQKFTPEAVDFLESVLNNLLSHQLKDNVVADMAVQFPCIKVKDSTKFSLPSNYNGAYQGYGNFSKKNGLLSLQYEYDLVSSNWLSIKMTSGLRNDQRDAAETIGDITTGGLHIRDLGYITPIYLKAVVQKHAFFLNRLPAMAGVFTKPQQPLDWKKIDQKIKKMHGNCLELDVMIFEKDMIPCRLILERVSGEEYQRRLRKAETIAKSKGVGISELHKIKLQYNLFITNVKAAVLPTADVRKTYYLRWQVELVFKTWKSFYRINLVKKVKKERLECQLLARLLWILINWGLFSTLNRQVRTANAASGVRMICFFKRSVQFAASLKLVLLQRMAINRWLQYTYLPTIADCVCESPHKKQTHYQTLNFNHLP